jgi:NAD+ synthase (glutamine-hydrolysing)
MKIAACALNQTPLDWTGNIERILQGTEKARKAGARLVLFPELALSGYGCEDYFFMPWVRTKAWENLHSQIVPASKGILLAVGMPYFHKGVLYNCLAVCQNGKLEGLYAKQILAKTGVFYESRWFEPWTPLVNETIGTPSGTCLFGDFTVSWNGIQVGFEICEDGWHPTSRPAKIGAAQNADLILNASASNYGRGKREERHAVIESLAGVHEGYYLYTNLVGNESGKLIFDGEIMFGSDGVVLSSSAMLSMRDVEVAVFDLEEPEQSFEKAADRNDFEEFTAAAGLGLLDYLRKSGSKGFALSLSGGADSAACAVLVAEMLKRAELKLGKAELERKLGFELKGKTAKEWLGQILVCVYQSTANSGEVTFKAASELANFLGAEFHHWQIDHLVSEYTKLTEQSIGRPLSWGTDDLVLQNIQARTRAPGIWMLANTRNFLLLTTSNRSEGDVGYCTMDGDTAGSLAPIAGVTKHFIRQWLVWARDQLQYPVLDLIIAQQPTAELRPSEQKQTDEADLMPYDLLEQIEVCWIGNRMSREETISRLKETRSEKGEYLESQVDRFIALWKRSQWKRERLAPSFHLDRFNIDPKSTGRFPILSK